MSSVMARLTYATSSTKPSSMLEGHCAAHRVVLINISICIDVAVNLSITEFALCFAALMASGPSETNPLRDPEFVWLAPQQQAETSKNEKPTSKSAAEGAEKENGPLTIKEVMRFTMTQGLCQKVIKNKASHEEQLRLVELFKKMAEQKPPIGDEQNWKAKSNALIAAAQEVSEGKPSHAALGKAANCAACHKDHRPKQ